MNYPTMHGKEITPYPANQLKVVPCPACQSDDVVRVRHYSSFRTPECWGWMCLQCEKEWGFE